MSYNTFGRHFRITTYGESHGPAIGVVIDGCPAGLTLDLSAINFELDRRKPGQSALTTERKEDDSFQITSGLVDKVTTGAPIHLSIPNKNARSKDYSNLKDVFRPSHADYTYHKKYGIRDHRGGGRSSARETACRVAAGAIAKQILGSQNIEILAFTQKIGPVEIALTSSYTLQQIESSPVRCPDSEASKIMESHILTCKEAGDTCGGIIKCITNNLPVGFGSPIYDKLEARLGYAMMSINACVGFEMGMGFASTDITGSAYNDEFTTDKNGKIVTKTNHGGGVQGGISNGMPLDFKCAFKPVSSIKKKQSTVDTNEQEVKFNIEGRHDPCVVPRAVPIVEAMAALVLVDFLLARRLDLI